MLTDTAGNAPRSRDAADGVLGDFIKGDRGLARELDKSPRTIARWRALGEGPPITRIGKSIWYSRAAVARWLAKRQVEAA